MKYDFAEIGNRVRTLRKKQYGSQDDFIEALNNQCSLRISRNTISAIENGNEGSFSLDFLLAACTLFECDMGYLLGEYGECKTRDEQFIHNQTGLSEKSIKRMVSNSGALNNAFLEFVLSSDFFGDIDFLFFEYAAMILRCNKHTAWYIGAEKELSELDPDSTEAMELRQSLGKGLMISGDYEERVFSREYRISLFFSKMLEEYRKQHLKTMDDFGKE